jgi:hypothetical protein
MLAENPWEQAQRPQIRMGERQAPTALVLERDESPPADLNGEILRQVRASQFRIRIPVSTVQARQAADDLEQVRQVLVGLRDLEQTSPASQGRWARLTAQVLVGMEQLIRRWQQNGLLLEPAPPEAPALRAAVGLLRGRVGQELLGPLESGEPQQVRQVLGGVVLRLSFALAGKVAPAGIDKELGGLLARAAEPKSVEAPLARRLESAVRAAPPAAPNDQLRRVVRQTLAWASRSLDMGISLARQWDRFESVELEYRRLAPDRPVIALTLRVAPGQEVRLGGGLLQPQLVLRGQTRMVVEPAGPDRPWTSVRLDGLDKDGAVLLRFRGPLWAMVQLLAVPVEDLQLRQIRLASASQGGRELSSVQLLAATASGRGDRRRMISLLQETTLQLDRRPFELTYREVRKDILFSYVRPDRLYTWSRVSRPAPPR